MLLSGYRNSLIKTPLNTKQKSPLLSVPVLETFYSNFFPSRQWSVWLIMQYHISRVGLSTNTGLYCIQPAPHSQDSFRTKLASWHAYYSNLHSMPQVHQKQYSACVNLGCNLWSLEVKKEDQTPWNSHVPDRDERLYKQHLLPEK